MWNAALAKRPSRRTFFTAAGDGAKSGSSASKDTFSSNSVSIVVSMFRRESIVGKDTHSSYLQHDIGRRQVETYGKTLALREISLVRRFFYGVATQQLFTRLSNRDFADARPSRMLV